MRDAILDDLLNRRGTGAKIATALGITPAAVSQWQRIPADRVAELARLLEMPAWQLRPDLFPAPEGKLRMAPRIPLRRRRCTKIVATLGPASSTQGADPRLFRRRGRRVPPQLQPWQPRRPRRALRQLIRDVEQKRGRPIGILADLQGPEAAGRPLRRRAGSSSPAASASGSTSTRRRATSSGSACRIPRSSPRCRPGTDLLLDDGKLRLRVERCGAGLRRDRVVVNGGAAVRPQGRQRAQRRACRSRR